MLFWRPLTPRLQLVAALDLCAAPAIHGSAAHSHTARTARRIHHVSALRCHPERSRRTKEGIAGRQDSSNFLKSC